VKKLDELRRRWRMSEDRLRLVTAVGDPGEVAERARALLDAGLDGLILSIADVHDVESVALVGETLSGVVATPV
jgi:alkanesulfonate monooxygenase SsuD/methylene tetrahydromethanopterin reductase-like flavin-dependent oxidoreductase (luciferase family)